MGFVDWVNRVFFGGDRRAFTRLFLIILLLNFLVALAVFFLMPENPIIRLGLMKPRTGLSGDATKVVTSPFLFLVLMPIIQLIMGPLVVKKLRNSSLRVRQTGELLDSAQGHSIALLAFLLLPVISIGFLFNQTVYADSIVWYVGLIIFYLVLAFFLKNYFARTLSEDFA